MIQGLKRMQARYKPVQLGPSKFVIINAQAAGTAEDPASIVVNESDLDELPADMLSSGTIVCKSPTHLAGPLLEDYVGWSGFRDRIKIGKGRKATRYLRLRGHRTGMTS